MIITQTPLRVSFLGGNTDFRNFFEKHGGCVLSSTIDKYIYCILNERLDDKIYVNWSKKEIVDSVSEIEHELVRESMKKVGVKKGVEITFVADIPSEGSGLGSSSSVLVGVLNALYHYKGISPSAQQLAEEACQIEIEVLNKPIGLQDQYIAAFGGLRFLQFHKSGKITTTALELSNTEVEDFDQQLMLFFTGMLRKSSSILESVKSNISDRTQILLKTKRLAEDAFESLKSGKLNGLGKSLHKGWELKKKMSGSITNGEIDAMYSAARNAGAIGGKITGAGGGGFLLLVVPPEKRKDIRKALKGYREVPFKLERRGSRVIFSAR